jgi:hypothetical protein
MTRTASGLLVFQFEQRSKFQMETRKTHFDQVPVAMVKKIAHEFSASEIGDRISEVDVSTPGDWREVAQRVQGETDSDKMLKLIHELIEKYDEGKTQKSRSVRDATASPTTNSASDRLVTNGKSLLRLVHQRTR